LRFPRFLDASSATPSIIPFCQLCCHAAGIHAAPAGEGIEGRFNPKVASCAQLAYIMSNEVKSGWIGMLPSGSIGI